MKIVFVGPFGLRPKGTMAVRALPLAKALVRRGHEVRLLLPPWDWPEDSGRTWDEAGVCVQNIALDGVWPLPQPVRITARLLQHIHRLQPDVVHCFKPKAYAGLVAWALWWMRKAGLTRARLIVDADDWEGAGGWNELGRYAPWQRRFFAWQEQWGLRHADTITVASQALQTIVWSLGVHSSRVHYIPNGVETAQPLAASGAEVRRKHALGGDSVVLLYTRFFEFGAQRAAEIWARVRAAQPAARLLIIGKGLFGEEAELLRLLETQGLGSSVVRTGWVAAEELPSYFAAADLAIYPFDDTLVNRCKCAVKLLDLLSAGVPVVADAVGQNAIYIQHEQNGLLVAPSDTEGFAEAVVRLLNDVTLRMDLGRRAREGLLANYSWDCLAQAVERAYVGTVSYGS